MWGAVAVSAGAQLLGGLQQSDAAKDAAGIQSGATGAGISETRRQFDLSRSDLAPYRTAGGSAVSRLQSLLGISTNSGKVVSNGQTFENIGALRQALTSDYVSQGGDPSTPQYQSSLEGVLARATPYDEPQQPGQPAAEELGTSPLTRKFTMEDMQADPVMKSSFDFGASEGEKAVRRMFGAKGLARSGAAVKAITRFASDYSGQQAGASRQRFVEDQNNLFGKLSAVAGTGQAATTATAGMGANASTNIGSMLVGEGNARGAASIAAGNAWGGAASGIGNTIAGQYTLDRILNRQPPAQPAGQFYLDT